jgi:chorismate mutase
MSYLDVYIGDLSDPSFHWDGGNWNGNVPTRLSPFFPDGDRIRLVVLERIDSEAYEGKQTDWGSYVAKVTKQQIEDLIEKQYRDHDWYKDPSPMPHMLQALQELRDFVDSLDEQKLHALVATEL